MTQNLGEFHRLQVNVEKQTLDCYDYGQQRLKQYAIATAKNGIGQKMGSECTPLGEHRIRAKIGANQPLNTVFIARRPTGEIYSQALAEQYPQRDWILTRILWLCGCQAGFNRFGQVDTMRRYIYLHGCPDSHLMGRPSSHGCIKMRNADIVELFDCVVVGTSVLIQRS